MWVFRCPDSLNALSHTWHLYGFSPLWILLCATRCPAWVNRLLQTVHSNGFSPEWLRVCVARCWLLPDHLPHSVHLYLPLWIFIYTYRLFQDKKHFPHWVHEYKFSPLCLSLWSFKRNFVVNRFSHTSQVKCTVFAHPVWNKHTSHDTYVSNKKVCMPLILQALV